MYSWLTKSMYLSVTLPVYIRLDKDRLSRCVPPYLVRDILILILVSVVTVLSTTHLMSACHFLQHSGILMLNCLSDLSEDTY